jgi:hypothetical protein
MVYHLFNIHRFYFFVKSFQIVQLGLCGFFCF